MKSLTLGRFPLVSEKASSSTLLTSAGLQLYLLFIVSWFLHLPARLPAMGAIRFDFLLIIAMTAIAMLTRLDMTGLERNFDKWLKILIAYSILTIPFVEWPGSVIRSGLPELVKALAFYYFTIAFVRDEKDLRKLIAVFVFCQLFRVMEPLYLHLTTGYWGDKAHMGGGNFLNRLSGAPHDVVNPNGLAFVICSVLPFVYFLSGVSWVRRLLLVVIAPLCIYALALTGSRSGMIALAVVYAGIIVKSNKRALLSLAGIAVVVVGFARLTAEQQDRYLSLVGMGPKNEATIDLRVDGLQKDLEVGLRKPIFGHGLGTSREANWTFRGRDQPSHDIYTETFQELGVVGLGIFLVFLASLFRGLLRVRHKLQDVKAQGFVRMAVDALQVLFVMDFVFSFASYGLLSYQWYLMGGLLIASERLMRGNNENSGVANARYRSGQALARFKAVRRPVPRLPADCSRSA